MRTKTWRSIEDSLTSRVSEFANAMNDVTARSGTVSDQINAHVQSFRSDTTAVLENLSGLAAQFAQQGRTLVEAVDSVENSNRRSEETVSERRATLENLVATLDLKSDDLEQRLQRFTALLDQSLERSGVPRPRNRPHDRGELDQRHPHDRGAVRTRARDHRAGQQADQRSDARDL